MTFTWDGMTHTSDHHGLSHRNGSVAVGGTCAAGVIDKIDQIDTWYAGRYSKLVNLINSINEGDRTMLDNSAVMWLPELADGNAHNNNNLPIVIAGSAGGYLKQGVSVNLDTRTLGTGNSEASCANGNTTVGFNTGSNTGTVPLNKLYVTLMNALGAANCRAGRPSPLRHDGHQRRDQGHHQPRRARRAQGVAAANRAATAGQPGPLKAGLCSCGLPLFARVRSVCRCAGRRCCRRRGRRRTGICRPATAAAPSPGRRP